MPRAGATTLLAKVPRLPDPVTRPPVIEPIEHHRSSRRYTVGIRAWLDRESDSALLVRVLVLAAAAGGATAGVHPTGTVVVDPLYGAAFGSSLAWLCSRAGRTAWILFATAAAAFSRGWTLVPGFASLAVAFASAFDTRARRTTGALMGAIGSQAILRWHPIGFHGLTAVIAALVTVFVFLSAYRRFDDIARSRARRVFVAAGILVLVFSLPTLIAGALAASKVINGEHEARSALDSVSNGSNADATTDLQEARTNFQGAAGQLDSWWTAPASLVPVVSQQRRALATGTSAAGRLAKTGASEVPSLDYRRLYYHDGQVNLAAFPAMLGPSEILDHAIAAASRIVSRSGSPWLLEPINSRLQLMQRDLGRAKSSTDLAVRAIPLLPAMLGGDGTRHYFVAFMTPSEARGLDGFVGAYGELTASGGKLTLTASGPIRQLLSAGIPAPERRLEGPADFLAQYGSFQPARYLQDATFSPDFPTVADVISQLYPQAGGDALDGVMAIDPYGLASLLRFTGPIHLDGLPVALTSQNAAKVLLTDQYTVYDNGQENDLARHDFLQDALHKAFDILLHGSLPGPKSLASALRPSVLQGRVDFWSNHPAEQPLLRSLRLEGAFPSAQNGDLLALTLQNAAANKIDALLHESTADRIVFDPATGSLHEDVSVSFRNDAPRSGLPPIVIDEPDAPAGTPPGANYAMVTLYSPLQLDQMTFDGRPVTLYRGRELGVNTYRTWITVPPLSTSVMEVSLSGRVGSRGRLPLTLWLQPQANPSHLSVDVSPSSGWSLSGGMSASWEAGPAATQRHVFQFTRS